MEIRKRKQVKTPNRPDQEPQHINSAHAAEVRRRAEALTEPVDIIDKFVLSVRSRQRQQAEQQMAKLRSEAVQARRLAEQIENLSQQAATYKHKRKHAMNDSTIVDPGHATRLQRRAKDKPATSNKQRNFNPLHPSMELPPEQLIRLLGMESKKIRKSRKTRRTSKQAPVAKQAAVAERENSAPASTPTPTPARPATQTQRPVDRSIQYERTEMPQVFDNGRSGLLVPALVAGVVAGIVVSGYLFWFQPADTSAQKAPAPVVASQPQKSQPKSKPVKRRPAPVAQEQKMNAQESAAWQATIKTREQRLRNAAEQRLAERVSQLQQAAQTNTAPVEAVPPPPVMPSEPAIDTVTSTATPAETAAQVPLQTTPDTYPEMPAPEPVQPVVTEVMEATESSIQAAQPGTNVVPVTPLEPAATVPAPVEAIPEPDAATGNESLDSEPVPAASEDTETEPVIEPASPEAASAQPDTSARDWTAVNAGDALF